jgi:diguanylate cyclase (GGDEF)-like protein
MEAQLSHQAFHDGLTGLANRALFEQQLAHALETVDRMEQQIAVLFTDLDNFKMINDSLGHAAGDRFLMQIANWLRDCVEKGDTIARFGGDEFMVLLTYPKSDPQQPVRMAERISQALQRSTEIDGHELSSRVSIGIAIRTDADQAGDDLLRKADIALYQCKRSGSGTLYRVFEEQMHEEIVDRITIERGIRAALARGEFEVHYQPIVDLRSGEITKLEGLIRWRHPDRGLVPPSAFLPVAEETGQIVEIDAWVMQEACRRIADWNHDHPERDPLLLGINVSVRDFRNTELINRVRSTLEETGFPPECLKLEITESTMMYDFGLAADVVGRLRDLGVGFAIDDFGTGYSSLAYLHRLKLDTLKIDRSFIGGLGGDEEDEAVVRTIISLASALELEVIAEGIETEMQLRRGARTGL